MGGVLVRSSEEDHVATIVKKGADFLVENRVSIALDTLNSEEKRAVNAVLAGRESFLKHAKSAPRVRRISESRPVFAVDVLPVSSSSIKSQAMRSS